MQRCFCITLKFASHQGLFSVTILEITDSEVQNSTQKSPRRSGKRSPVKSPLLPTPRKSALKDPKRNSRKTESIKFDLSNLGNRETSDLLTVTDTTKQTYDGGISESEMTLHYSDVSSSPSPRRPINSRSSKILEKTLGTTVTLSPSFESSVRDRTLAPDSPGSRKSLRGSLILQKALDSPTNGNSDSTYSRRTSKTISETSQSDASLASAFKTRTLSPRTTRNDIESYSIVDLVSIDSNDTVKSASLYNSAGSSNSTEFGTPQNSIGRKTRSTIDNNFLGSSTPYVGKVTRSSSRGLTDSYKSQSSPNLFETSKKSIQSNKSTIPTRRSKSLTTPENTQKHISVNSTRISRRSRSRSRINDSDLFLLDEEDSDSSPKTSRRVTKASQSFNTVNESNSLKQNEGTITPEDRHSPQDAGTPVLSIQSLLNSSQSSLTSQSSYKNGRRSYKRKTIGVLSENRKRQSDFKSRSLNISAKKTKLRLSKESSDESVRTDEGAPLPDNEEVVTPKSAVKLLPEAVKNKHSTAKKPLSKRSIIDDLNQSDIVKQLFNSPVKRKLSQSMTEFSRKRLFDEDDDIIIAKRPTRNTVALTNRTPNNSLMDQTEVFTPERFVSPINTPSNSPNLSGIKRLFRKNSPENDLRDVRGVKGLLRTPRARVSASNNLTNVSGVKSVFARSPLNRLSDVRVKGVFAKSPENDLTDVRGVKIMFKQKSPENNLRNVSGVKRLQRKSPKNDLTDVRGVRQMFKQNKPRATFNVSGVEELFNTSNQSNRDTDSLFDQLLGKPPVRAVYSNTFSAKVNPTKKSRQTKSLHSSIDQIINNVEEWLQNELQKRLNTDKTKTTTKLTRELSRIATDTVEGTTPIRRSRVRDSTLTKIKIGENERKKSASEIYSARKLPIKKRSLVEKSLEASDNGEKSRLPIKKRLLVHSTPVKGWSTVTLNASELGRVSPITSADKTTVVVANTRNTKGQNVPKSKATTKSIQQSTSVQTIDEEPTVPLQPLPKRTRAAAKNSPKIKNTRSRKNVKNATSDNTVKKRKSLVVTKKSPVMSPTGTEVETTVKLSRRQQQVKVVTPKTTRAKVRKGTVILPKPSPALKPKVAKNVEKDMSNIKTRGREAINESHKEFEKITRNKAKITNNTSEAKISKAAAKISEQLKEVETKGRARVVIEKDGSVPSKVTRQTRRTKANSPTKSPQKSPMPKTRRGRVMEETEVAQQRGRKRKAADISEVTQPRVRKQSKKAENAANETKEPVKPRNLPKGRKRQSEQIELPKRRTRLNNEVIEPVNQENAKQKPKRIQKALSDEPKVNVTEMKTRRGKSNLSNSKDINENPRTKRTSRLQKTVSNELEVKTKGRKRKSIVEEIVAPKVRRGRNKTIGVEETLTTTVKRRVLEKDSNIEVGKSKSDRTMDKSGVAGRGRGRRTAAPAVVSVEETKKRSRGAKAVTSLASDTSKVPVTRRTGAKEVAYNKTPLKTRAQRAKETKETQVAKGAASRTRRR